jgi:uroporphyrinogen decarboxylase
MGYDFVMMELALPFPTNQLSAPDTAVAGDGARLWANQTRGMISSWEEFERYPWPAVTDEAFEPYHYVDTHLPEGMGLMASHAGGVFEHLTWIMSYEGLCWALHDNPELVDAVVNKIGSLLQPYFARLLELKNLIALWPGDDMGFRTATLVSPAYLRQSILPWHRLFARMAHDRGVAYFLHTCGNVEAIMSDLIDIVGIDGRHSFEDTIMPAQVFQQCYGRCIATLGGVDVHVLASGEPRDVRRYVRNLLDACAPGGRFAVGSGNSIPNYVPLENYFVMLDEALR